MKVNNWFDRYGMQTLSVLAVGGLMVGTLFTGYQTNEQLYRVRADFRRQAQIAEARKQQEHQQIQVLVDSMNRAEQHRIDSLYRQQGKDSPLP